MPIPNLRYFTSLQLSYIARAASARKEALQQDSYGMTQEDEAEWAFLDLLQKEFHLLLAQSHHLSEADIQLLFNPPDKSLLVPELFDPDKG